MKRGGFKWGENDFREAFNSTSRVYATLDHVLKWFTFK